MARRLQVGILLIVGILPDVRLGLEHVLPRNWILKIEWIQSLLLIKMTLCRHLQLFDCKDGTFDCCQRFEIYRI